MADPKQTPPPDSPAVEARIRALEEYIASLPTTPEPATSIDRSLSSSGRTGVHSMDFAGGTIVHVFPVVHLTLALLFAAVVYLVIRKLRQRRG